MGPGAEAVSLRKSACDEGVRSRLGVVRQQCSAMCERLAAGEATS